MLRWLASYVLDRALIALALTLAYVTWGGSLRQPVREALALTDGVTSPFEKILRALE